MRDLAALAAGLGRMSAALEKAADAALEAGLDAALKEARVRAPVDSGQLRANIRAEAAGREGRLVSAAPHAAMVEFGTSRMSPRPYMAPAAGAARTAFFEAAREGARRAVKEGWK